MIEGTKEWKKAQAKERKAKLAELAEVDQELSRRILYLTCILKPYKLDGQYCDLIEREKELKRELGIKKEGE
jgi:hypothetical protein